MSPVSELSFGVVGLLTLTVYLVGIARGAVPEVALLVAVGGGLVVGVLASIALRILATSPGSAEEGRRPTRESTMARRSDGADPSALPADSAPTANHPSIRPMERA